MTLQAPWYQAFFQRLRDLGWAPGRNITIEYCFADNRPNQLPALLKDFENAIYVPAPVPFSPARPPIRSIPSSSNPMMEGHSCRFRRDARARERHQTAGG